MTTESPSSTLSQPNAAPEPPVPPKTPPGSSVRRAGWLRSVNSIAGASIALTVTSPSEGTFLVHRKGTFKAIPSPTVPGVITLAVGPIASFVEDFHVRSLTDPAATVIALRMLKRPSCTDEIVAQQIGKVAEFQWNERDVLKGIWHKVKVLALTKDAVIVEHLPHEGASQPNATETGTTAASATPTEVPQEGRLVIAMKLPVANVRVDPSTIAWETTAMVTLGSTVLGDHLLEFSYTSRGITWSAEYSAVLSEDGKSIELDGHFVVENRCGKSFHGAQLTLCSGNSMAGSAGSGYSKRAYGASQQQQQQQQSLSSARPDSDWDKSTSTSSSIGGGQRIGRGIVRKVLADTGVASSRMEHFSVPIPVDFPDGTDVHALFCSTLRVDLTYRYTPVAPSVTDFEAAAKEINLDRNFLAQPTTSVECIMQFVNPADVASPRTFPPGPLRVVYKQSTAGLGIQHFGSFYIPLTRPGEAIFISEPHFRDLQHFRLQFAISPRIQDMGQSNRLKGERKRIDVRLDRKGHVLSETFSLSLINRGSDDSVLDVNIEEYLLRWREWTIVAAVLDGSFDAVPWKRVGSSKALFVVKAPRGVTTLTYTVHYVGWLFPSEISELAKEESPQKSMPPPPPPPLPPPPPPYVPEATLEDKKIREKAKSRARSSSLDYQERALAQQSVDRSSSRSPSDTASTGSGGTGNIVVIPPPSGKASKKKTFGFV